MVGMQTLQEKAMTDIDPKHKEFFEKLKALCAEYHAAIYEDDHKLWVVLDNADYSADMLAKSIHGLTRVVMEKVEL